MNSSFQVSSSGLGLLAVSPMEEGEKLEEMGKVMEATVTSPLMAMIISSLFLNTSHLSPLTCTVTWGIQFLTLVLGGLHSSHRSISSCFCYEIQLDNQCSLSSLLHPPLFLTFSVSLIVFFYFPGGGDLLSSRFSLLLGYKFSIISSISPLTP
jgi:hypothetical protein